MTAGRPSKKTSQVELREVERLLQRWDPIGVIDEFVEGGLSPDEYDSYAPAVLTMLRRGCGKEELAHHLEVVAKVSMDLETWRERNERTADELLQWWSTRQDLGHRE